MNRVGALWLACALSTACTRGQAPSTSNKQLPAGTLAEVANEGVAQRTVERIAEAQSVSPRRALELAVSDASFALEARARFAAEQRASLVRAASARSVLDGIQRDARARGVASDDELKAIASERWNELDRPPSVRVSHAVALAKRDDPKRPAARELAERIRREVADQHEAQAFLRTARAVPHADIRIVAESLPFICADGRSMSNDARHVPGSDFDLAFARAANDLAAPGAVSSVVESDFGFHVILLEERLPALRAPLESLRGPLAAEVLSRRAAHTRSELLERLHRETRVETARDVEQATQKLVQ